MLSQLVNIWFQVLFHSPSGVLFNFPSRYYTLSVTRSYLAFGDGPPIFMPDFTCPALLWILARACKHLIYGAITLFRLVFQKTSTIFVQSLCASPKPQWYFYLWFGLLPVRSPLLRQSLNYFLFLQILRCFNSLRSLYYTMYSCNNAKRLCFAGSPIQKSTDHGLFASPRSLSQLTTSFFGV